MTKKLLLTAAALGVMAIAGTASAGNITSAKFSKVPLPETGSGATQKVSPYLVATETVLTAAGTSTTVADGATDSSITISMDSPVSISAGAKVPFAVVYTITGPGEFGATPLFSDLLGLQTTPSASSAPAASGVVVLSADKKTLSFFVEMGTSTALNVQSLQLQNLVLKVKEKADVSIAAEAKVTVAGFTQVVSTVPATPVVRFAQVLKPSAAATYTAIAKLSDYKTFTTNGTAGNPASATASVVTSNPVYLTETAGIRKNLAGGSPLTVSSILTGATATVTGPQVKDLLTSFAGVATPGSATATSASFSSLSIGNLTSNSISGSMILTNPDAPANKVIEQGTYSVALKPIFDTDFSGNADQTLNLIKVDLAGTNFTAPWFALDNGTANSTLRLANNGSAPVGPIIISLKANNGSAAPTGTHTIASIPAGGFVSVRGDQLKTAFGTSAANGDLQITIQSDIANVSAKVRTTQSNGQIYENSLGSGSGALVN